MKVKFYGVRGSYPVSGPDTVRYGGNTTCVTVYQETAGKVKNRIILDSGTGIIKLSKDILGNFFSGKESLGQLPLFFTHLHPDHTQGFPFAAFNYLPQCNLDLYGMCALRQHVEGVLEQQQMPPVFPLEYRDLKSTRNHHILKDGDEIHIGESKGLTVKVMQAYSPSHPQQGALYYKITDEVSGKSVACIWDNESHIGGDKAVINFIRGCDLVIHDTQYTEEEYLGDKPVVQGFGHSTYDMALDNAAQAGVKKMACIHYNPAHTDERLDEIAGGLNGAGVEVIFSKEGMEIEI